LKLSDNEVVPLRVLLPRITSRFAADVFPPTAGFEASRTAQQYFSGDELKPLKHVSMDPDNAGNKAARASIQEFFKQEKTVISKKHIVIQKEKKLITFEKMPRKQLLNILRKQVKKLEEQKEYILNMQTNLKGIVAMEEFADVLEQRGGPLGERKGKNVRKVLSDKEKYAKSIQVRKVLEMEKIELHHEIKVLKEQLEEEVIDRKRIAESARAHGENFAKVVALSEKLGRNLKRLHDLPEEKMGAKKKAAKLLSLTVKFSSELGEIGQIEGILRVQEKQKNKRKKEPLRTRLSFIIKKRAEEEHEAAAAK